MYELNPEAGGNLEFLNFGIGASSGEDLTEVPLADQECTEERCHPNPQPAKGEGQTDTTLQDFAVSVFAAPVKNTTDSRLVDWQELCRMLAEDVVVIPDNKNETKARYGQYFVRGTITGNRNDANLTKCCLLILDIDKPLPGGTLPTPHELHDALGDIIHVVYSTASPGRSRVVVPVQAYPISEIEQRTRALYNFCRSLRLEFELSGESKTASQPFFYGQALAKEIHVCLVNHDGEGFKWQEAPEAEPDEQQNASTDDHPKDNADDQKKGTNHLQKLIEELKSGTIHQAAKEWAGWQCRVSTLTKRQIFDDLTVLIEEHCSDRDKVARWHSGERVKMEEWFEANVKGQEPAPVVMTAEECQTDSNLTLEIPAHVLDPGGLISLGMTAVSQPGMSGIPQYGLPTVLTTIANAIAGMLVFRGVWPNLYNIKVGPTSTGKSDSDKAMVSAIGERIAGFYGPTNFSSGQALMRALADNPQCMVVIDEGGSIFRRSGRADPISDGKREFFLECFSASGKVWVKAYADKKSNITIYYPCLSLTANATSQIFESIENVDFSTGIMQRFDFWCYDGPALRRAHPTGEANVAMAAFVDGLQAIREAIPNSTHGNMVGVLPGSPRTLQIDQRADDRLQEWSDIVIDRGNKQDDDGLRGIVSRSYDLAIKYAMVHLAATYLSDSRDHALVIEDIEYGIDVAWMLADWKIKRLRNRVTCGDFHRDAELFKEAIRRAVSAGRRPTLSVLANRCRPLQNFPDIYLEQITRTLASRGEIVADTTKKPTAYNLVKV